MHFASPKLRAPMSRRGAAGVDPSNGSSSSSVDWEPRSAWNELHQCASRGELQGVRALIAKALHDEDKYELKSSRKRQTRRLELATKNGDRAMHLALRGGFVDVFRELLRAGADPHARGHGGETAFLICAKNGLLSEMELLFDAFGKDILAEATDSGWTAMHLAAAQDRSDTLRFLRARDAPFNVVDHEGNTPLHLAAKMGSVGAIRWLVDNDEVLLRAENKLGQTPEKVARNAQRVEAVGALWSAQESLAEKRKVPSTFHKLASSGDLAGMKALYQTWGVAVHDIADWRNPKTGSNATLEACANGKLNVLKFLFSLPGKRELMNEKTGQGALMISAIRGHGHVCKYLVEEKGMDPSSGTDATGKTPAEAAMEHQHPDVAAYLNARERELREHAPDMPAIKTDDNMLSRMVSLGGTTNSTSSAGLTRGESDATTSAAAAPGVSSKSKDLFLLLQSFDLAQYFSKLVDEGFDTPSHLTRVMESDLVRWGMKPGHRRTLLECVDQLRSSSSGSAAAAAAAAAAAVVATTTASSVPGGPGASFPIARISSAPLLTTPPSAISAIPGVVSEGSSASTVATITGGPSSASGAAAGNAATFVKIIHADELEMEDRVLGEGSFGIVRVATWRGSKVAVKALKLRVTVRIGDRPSPGTGTPHSETAIPSEVERDLRNEALVMQRVSNHANIIPFVGFVLTPTPSVVTALMPFGSVEALLVSPGWVRGTLEGWGVLWSVALKFARDAAAGMLHLHAERVIHRDFSARNLLVDAQGNVRVADFGFARVKDSNTSKGYSKQSVGPLLWMSPESIRKKTFSEKSDVFSYGVTLWEILVGSPPWEGQDTMDVVFRVYNGERLPLPVHAPIPRDVLALLEDSWRQDPAARPSSKVVLERMERAWRSMPTAPPFPALYERAVSSEFSSSAAVAGSRSAAVSRAVSLSSMALATPPPGDGDGEGGGDSSGASLSLVENAPTVGGLTARVTRENKYVDF